LDADCNRALANIPSLEMVTPDPSSPRVPPQFIPARTANSSSQPYEWRAPTQFVVDIGLDTRPLAAGTSSTGGSQGGRTTNPREVLSVFGDVLPAADIDVSAVKAQAKYIVSEVAGTATLHVTVTGAIKEFCPGFLRIELRNERTRDVVSMIDALISDGSGSCPMPFSLEFEAAVGTAEEYFQSKTTNALSTKTNSKELVYFTITLLGSNSRVTVKPRLGASVISYAIDDTLRVEDAFEMSDEQTRTLWLAAGFFIFVLLLWSIMCCCAAQVQHRGPFDLAVDLSWHRSPFQKLSYMAQDLVPASRSSSEFKSDKHSGVVLAILVSGIARSILFSFTLFYIILVWVTANDIATLGQFGTTMNDTSERIENVSGVVDAYRESELWRQRVLADNLTASCWETMSTLEAVSKANQNARREQHMDAMEACNRPLLRAGLQRLIQLEAASDGAAFRAQMALFEAELQAQHELAENRRQLLVTDLTEYRNNLIRQHETLEANLDDYSERLDKQHKEATELYNGIAASPPSNSLLRH
jgi:hypothetical protein